MALSRSEIPWPVTDLELAQDALDRLDVLLHGGMARVHDVHDDVGVLQLLESRPERSHELMGQLPDEADRIGEDERARPLLDEASGRIERDEQLIGCREACAREPVEQRRLAGVGIADERDHGNPGAPAPVPL